MDASPPPKKTVQINPLLGKISQMTFSSEKYSFRLATGVGEEKPWIIFLFLLSTSVYLLLWETWSASPVPWPALEVCSLEPHLHLGYPTKYKDGCLFWKLLQGVVSGSEVASVFQILRLEGNTELLKGVTDGHLGLSTPVLEVLMGMITWLCLLRSRLNTQAPGDTLCWGHARRWDWGLLWVPFYNL